MHRTISAIAYASSRLFLGRVSDRGQRDGIPVLVKDDDCHARYVLHGDNDDFVGREEPWPGLDLHVGCNEDTDQTT